MNEASKGVCIVGVGASAGGLEAIREMLAPASGDSGLAYVVVQHLDPNHESLLAELLGRHTSLEVHQAAGGEKVDAGRVYIIPPGHGLSIKDGVLSLTDFAQPRGLRRPIDDFFESLANDQGRKAACVILSGTGADGTQGLRAIKENGGLCIVQEPKTARYDGMPTSATGTGLVDFVRPPDQIVDCILQFNARADGTRSSELGRTVAESIKDICAVLHREVGHDFAGYKQSTLVRRIERRIHILSLPGATEYLDRLRSDRDECVMLFRELLINVTRFFRDTEFFETLRTEIVTPLVAEAGPEEVRVWVAGCSSGEEAYSVAMLFAEEFRVQDKPPLLQIFATDIDEQMLRIARQGSYPLSALLDIPEPMRDRYTVPHDGSFRISARLRDMVRFSVHSVVRDPPFSNIDLVTCRNLLIYLGDRLQQMVLPVFHYAIRPGGALFLGPSETIGRYEDLFRPIDARARLFRRNMGRPEYPIGLRGQSSTDPQPARPQAQEAPRASRSGWQRQLATQRLLGAYAPPSVQVTRSGEVLSTTGQLGKYLDAAYGDHGPRFVQGLARPGLREAVSAALRRTQDDRRPSITRDLSALSEFGTQTLDLIAEPLSDGTILLVFRDHGRFQPAEADSFVDLEPSDSHVQSLEEDLRSTRARLHTTVEELETANEELKSSNEEMMSMNEELQSTNEELATVNDELKSKVDLLSVANADLQNFFNSTVLPLVVLDNELHIRNFTEAILSVYPIRGSDRGRPLSEMKSLLDESDDILDRTREVVATGEVRQMTVTETGSERTWALVITPYRTRDGRTEGATLVFTELTSLLQVEAALEAEGRRLQLALSVAGLGIWEYDRSDGSLSLDGMSARMLGIAAERLPLDAALEHVSPEDAPAIAKALETSQRGDAIEVTFRVPGDGSRPRSLQLVGQRMPGRIGPRTLGVLFDVTAEQEAVEVRELMLREMNHRVKNMFSIIIGMLRIVGRSSRTVPEVIEGVERRVAALARSHDLTQRRPQGMSPTIENAVASALAPYASDAAVRMEGPDIAVSEKQLTALSLLFHEWATNSAKYGVLGPVDGHLSVTWQRDDGEVTVAWNEIYDSDVDQKPHGSGFGTTLIDLSAAQLRGRASVEADRRSRQSTITYPEAVQGNA